MSEIQRCRHCGGSARSNLCGTDFYVTCVRCRARGPVVTRYSEMSVEDAIDESIDAWNQGHGMEVISLNPGDTVVIYVPGSVDSDTADRLRRAVEAKFQGHPVLILGDGLRVGTIHHLPDPPEDTGGIMKKGI